ncbi:uncharacterized protein LOC121604575 isoform X2 [Chelmon rostratus]|uniref:uncharacterized protein LOC121604575 isoform X2 n=1 Tax=Chelmon rostratus TaxID=109905 RepID=UPI001BE969B0|nr:uncharacterized protein LOC121604575 isoform X2 [Chelmon rostratus]
MDAEVGLESGLSQRENKRSLKDSMMDEEELERLYKEPKGLLNKQHSGNSGAEPALYGAESSSFLPASPVCVPQARWEIRTGGEDFQDKLLHLCCTAEGSIDQASPSSMLEYLVYLDNQHNMADCPITTAITPPATPVSHRPYRDTLRSTSRGPGCSKPDPVSAAAHLHLLGESLSLIGHHLQETNKMVSVSSSLSLLLDSLLCALAPLICLTTEIPELQSDTQHTLASTLENIAYVMPGM